MVADPSRRGAPHDFRSVLQLASCRRPHSLVCVEGVRNIAQCADNQVPIARLVVAKRLLTSVAGQVIVRRLRSAGVPATTVTPEQFRELNAALQTGVRASGVAAVVHTPWHELPEAPPRRGLWLALDHLRSPGNLGTTIRTAGAVGAEGVILTSPETEPFRREVIRASMGAVFAEKLIRASPVRLREWSSLHGVKIVGASPGGSARFDRVVYPDRSIVWIGNERAGLGPELRSMCDLLVRIPMAPGVDSLNAGVAAGVLLFAARYRVTAPGGG